MGAAWVALPLPGRPTSADARQRRRAAVLNAKTGEETKDGSEESRRRRNEWVRERADALSTTIALNAYAARQLSREFTKPLASQARLYARQAWWLLEPLPRMVQAQAQTRASELTSADGPARAARNEWPHRLASSSAVFKQINFGAAVRLRVHCERSAPRTDASESRLPSPESVCLMLHGFLGSTHSWSAVQQPLADALNVHAISYDRPGFGLTSRPSSDEWKYYPEAKNPYALASSADHLLNLIASFQRDLLAASDNVYQRGQSGGAIVVAHSFGCLTALLAAQQRPDLLRALVLIAPPAPFLESKQVDSLDSASQRGSRRGASTLASAAQRAFSLALDRVPGLAERYIRARYERLAGADADEAFRALLEGVYFDVERADVSRLRQVYTAPIRTERWDAGLVEFMKAMDARDAVALDELRAIDVPTLVIAGRHDGVLPMKGIETVASALPNAELHIIEDAAHCPHEETPLQVVHAIESFVTKLAIRQVVS